MQKSAIFHTSEGTYAYAVGPNRLVVRLRAATGDLETVKVHYKNLYDHVVDPSSATMKLAFSDGVSDVFETTIEIDGSHFKYRFELDDGRVTYYYSSDGFSKTVNDAWFFVPMINSEDVINEPEWCEGEIVYQIFVDRFFNGDHNNDPVDVCPWNKMPDRSTYYGGDFAGIMLRIPYLVSLGVKIIYLSPVFLSPTYHKYDVQDYYAIDPAFGDVDSLKALVDHCHKQGIRVVLDGVFNHCSSNHPFFRDVVAFGASSPYVNWFSIHSFPVTVAQGNYDSFANLVPSMPRLNTDNPEVIEYLVNAAVYWTITLKIDGWRMDVADEISPRFWRAFRTRVKLANPNILLIGEIWNIATRWLAGDQLDTVTNYKYRKSLTDLAKGNITSTEFHRRMDANRILYKTPVHSRLVNLIGSHDVERIAEAFGQTKALMMLAVTLAYEGMPLIYYGDELGMTGGADPDNRRAMTWERTDTEQAQCIRALALIRSSSETLKQGRTETLPTQPRVLAFVRIHQGQKLAMIANFGNRPYRINQTGAILKWGHARLMSGGYVVPGSACALFELSRQD